MPWGVGSCERFHRRGTWAGPFSEGAPETLGCLIGEGKGEMEGRKERGGGRKEIRQTGWTEFSNVCSCYTGFYGILIASDENLHTHTHTVVKNFIKCYDKI